MNACFTFSINAEGIKEPAVLIQPVPFLFSDIENLLFLLSAYFNRDFKSASGVVIGAMP